MTVFSVRNRTKSSSEKDQQSLAYFDLNGFLPDGLFFFLALALDAYNVFTTFCVRLSNVIQDKLNVSNYTLYFNTY